MSGCLTFQRPVICSTTSFESMRTATAACGIALERRLESCDQPAVLGDVVGGDADVDADLAEHRAGLRVGHDRSPGRDARVSPGSPIGFDDEAVGHRPESSPRTRMQPHSGQVTI